MTEKPVCEGYRGAAALVRPGTGKASSESDAYDSGDEDEEVIVVGPVKGKATNLEKSYLRLT